MTELTVHDASAGTGLHPTAPLPSAAAYELHVAELRASFPEDIVRAVVRFEIARDRKADLEAKPTREWSGAEFDSWVDCDRVIAESRAVLAEAGLLRLAPSTPAEMAAYHEAAEARANELIQLARTGCMSDLNADDLAHYVDLMAGSRATLAAAGRLDLIGVT